MHRAANLRHLATNLERLLNNGGIDSSNGLRTIRRANALATAYQNLDEGCDFGLASCSCPRELRDIVGGLVEIFGHTVGSLVLSVELQPLQLAGEMRRALLLLGSCAVLSCSA